MAKNVFWYDGFMNSDDALALDILLESNDAELIGLSESFKIEDRNEGICSEIERKTSLEIYPGSQRPIIAHASIACGHSFNRDSDTKAEKGFAWDAMVDAAKKAGHLTLLCAGSLTNIAIALLRYDDFTDYIEKIVFIAGTVGIGDCAAMSDCKAALDAYAMRTVLTSGVELLYIGMDAWDSRRAAPVDMVSCALNSTNLVTQRATMDVETVVCDQFARFTLDTRVRNKAEKNGSFIFLNGKEN